MSSEKCRDGFEFACDACGNELSPPRLGRGSESRSWHECWELAKEKGWCAVKVKSKSGKDDWEHRCPACSGK